MARATCARTLWSPAMWDKKTGLCAHFRLMNGTVRMLATKIPKMVQSFLIPFKTGSPFLETSSPYLGTYCHWRVDVEMVTSTIGIPLNPLNTVPRTVAKFELESTWEIVSPYRTLSMWRHFRWFLIVEQWTMFLDKIFLDPGFSTEKKFKDTHIALKHHHCWLVLVPRGQVHLSWTIWIRFSWFPVLEVPVGSKQAGWREQVPLNLA